MLEVWIDGACEPVNPKGTASYGLVIKQNGNLLYSESKIVGKGEGYSNNVAEYSGLIAFLKWLLTTGKLSSLAILDYDYATIRSDSLMLINQMSGAWRVKQGMYVPYYHQAIDFINTHGLYHHLTFKWIPREENWEADNLSKQALIAIGIKPKH